MELVNVFINFIEQIFSMKILNIEIWAYLITITILSIVLKFIVALGGKK